MSSTISASSTARVCANCGAPAGYPHQPACIQNAASVAAGIPDDFYLGMRAINRWLEARADKSEVLSFIALLRQYWMAEHD